MAVSDHVDLEQFMGGLRRRNPGETEFQQAVYEVASNVFDYIADKEIYHDAQILRRIAEPDRVVSFRVCWEDDNGNLRVQRGWRVQNNNAIGPYKGGLRFHPSVSQSIFKFLAFEQTEADRDCRRPQCLRGWGHGQENAILTGGAGAGGAAGGGARG